MHFHAQNAPDLGTNIPERLLCSLMNERGSVLYALTLTSFRTAIPIVSRALAKSKGESHEFIVTAITVIVVTHFPVIPDVLNRYSISYGQEKGTSSNEDVPLCPIVTNYRTFIDDLYKVLEFVEWYKEWY